jgi:hypothetical protein
MPKFAFYERVRVLPNLAELAEIHGATGTILGRSEDGAPEYGYGVFIDAAEIVWDVPESSLESLGEIKKRADFYDDNVSLRVRVDAEGCGRIVD